MPCQSCGGAKLAAPISFGALAACFGSKNALARDGEAAACCNCRSKPNTRQTCGTVWQNLGANQTDSTYVHLYYCACRNLSMVIWLVTKIGAELNR
jgi:hypothetical protein